MFVFSRLCCFSSSIATLIQANKLFTSRHFNQIMSNVTIFADSRSNQSAEINNTHGDINLWRHSPSVTVLCIIAYSVVFVVGLVGNFFVISVVWRVPRMKNVTNLFIVNLAFADILVILLAVPGTLLSHIYVRKLDPLFL
jgi:hypothetical protein